jgi:RHS repeat-associated protein
MGRALADRRTNGTVTGQTNYAYNLAGAVTVLTYPFIGFQITYGYDTAGRTRSAAHVGWSVNYVTQATYAPHGALASVKYGESGTFAIPGTYTFNSRLQPQRIKIERNDATGCLDAPSVPGVGCVLDLVYNFNAGVANNGNVLGITNRRDANRNQSFTYDELNRVKTAQSQATSGPHDWGLSFTYDVWANLLSQTVTKGDDVPMLSVTAGNTNRLSSPGFSYDAAGNMIANGSATYSYDAENHLTSTAGVSYVYDGDGRRVKKSNGTLYWYGMSGEVLVETDLAGSFLREYVYFNGQRVAKHDVGGNWYLFADHLGSARVMTWQNGVTGEESDFYPFGGERVITDTISAPYDNKHKFTGQERDAESTTDYFRARQYAYTLGRFLSPDPSDRGTVLSEPQTLNRYTYVTNNPLRYIDPNGLWRLPVDGDVTVRTNKANPKIGDFGASREGGKRTHKGVDIVASKGTPVKAAEDGTVKKVASDDEGGKYVTIGHGKDVNGKEITTSYFHLDSQSVKEGNEVKEGHEIGKSGTTGNAEGLPKDEEHVHFEVSVGGERVDPVKFIEDRQKEEQEKNPQDKQNTTGPPMKKDKLPEKKTG